MAEKFYSVIAEMADGTRTVVPVRGETPGGVFQQVKGMPDVRRVGKVTEVTQADFTDLLNGKQPRPPAKGTPHAGHGGSRGGDRASAGRMSAEAGSPRESLQSLAGHGISGPRVVIPARRTGGEQPFKHLKAGPGVPLDRPAPARPPVVLVNKLPPAQPPAPRPEPAAQTNQPQPAPQSASAEPTTTVQEYRIVKSRRRDGPSYLLQRGQWQDLKGKRTFGVDWEKGFDDREKAERHLEWLKQTAQELAEVAHHEPAHHDEPAEHESARHEVGQPA